MKTITHEAKRIGSTRSSTGPIAVLLTLSWCVQASGEIQASPPKRSAVAAEDQAATTPTGRPEVWICAGGRIAELLRPDAEWPFVKQHLTGIKLYVGLLTVCILATTAASNSVADKPSDQWTSTSVARRKTAS